MTAYAYILFQVEPLVTDPAADIRYLLLGYPVVFALYLISGVLRILRHGERASKPRHILIWGGVFVVLFFTYTALRRHVDHFDLNCAALGASVLAMYAYRSLRRRSSPSPPAPAVPATAKTAR